MAYGEEERAAEKSRQRTLVKRWIQWSGAGVMAIVLMIFASCSMETVEPGHRGIKVSFGKPGNEALTEGLYFVNPFSTKLVTLDTRVLKWEGKTQAYTRDVQQADIQFTLNYRLDPTQAHVVFREVGKDWAGVLIGQVVVEEIKREIGQHEAVDLVAQRNQATRLMETNIVSLLGKKHIQITSFQMTNIDYTKEFEQAVEAKVVAQQKAIEEQNRTVQKRELATQVVVQAEGAAKALVLNAEAEAKSITIRANALANNPKLVEWEAVQKWDGKLPVYSMGSATPFVNLPNK